MFKPLFAALLLTTAAAASAASYDVVTDFAAGGPFTFGSDFGASFTPLPAFSGDNCLGVGGLACFYTNGTAYNFPAVGKNVSRSDPLSFYTNVLPKDMLFVQTNPGTSATIRFTAPVASTYTLNATFTRIDTTTNGDGVYAGQVLPYTAGGGLLAPVYGNALAFDSLVQLAAGQSVYYTLYAGGDTNYDGTGFQLTATSVPEPASWALLVAGFALTGLAARRRGACTLTA